ncbi:MBL fold metallo-hydrolase [Williamsia sp.]|uniref:MBL fold metallo-hydrolase n=1 Tax=Williamsia sp. TaxID=1872085 RepID=UPI001A2F0FB0|nr:MBL fold metallo-hydrolase [Williamsia sp.]MBJ7287374.1 MBL fold metallo-hydrolase [Williamsia sp.]
MRALGSMRRVRHLNCGTFRARLGGPALVSQVVVCEFEHGLALIDSGLGADDVAHANSRLGVGFRLLLPALDTAETAVEQIGAMGFSAADVTDIVLTHMDLDHIGGAADFTSATVHTSAAEQSSATSRTDAAAKVRYRAPHLRAVKNRTSGYSDFTDELFGFTGHRLHDSVRAIPMPGHTVGHCAIAINDPQRGWLLHAGDAFHHRRAITGQSSGRSISMVETALADDRRELRTNQRRLADLAAQAGGPQIFCAHDPVQFAALVSSQVE